MRQLRAILFDLGGTLLHYHDPISDDPQRPFRRITRVGVERVCEQLAAYGIRPPDLAVLEPALDRHIAEGYTPMVRELRGGSTVEVPIRAALAECGVHLTDAHWTTLRESFYRAIDSIVALRTGAVETLAALQEAGYRLGLISNTYWASDLHDRHLAENDLLGFLPVRVYSCDTPVVKPHPAIFLHALGIMQIRPEEAVYVGDRPEVDVQGAQNAGMRGILIRSPYMTTRLDGILPDAIIDELPDLIPALAGLDGP